MKEFQICFIDDEPEILTVFEDIMEDSEFQFVGFTNSQDFFNHLKISKSVVGVVSDFRLIDETGFDIRDKMLQEKLTIPFIMVTGSTNSEVYEMAMERSIVKFINKPFDHNQILDSVEKFFSPFCEGIKQEREMVTEFLQETSTFLDEIEELILNLEENPYDIDTINTYFRILHTIKGTASCLELKVIADFAHEYEGLITAIKNKEIEANADVCNILLKALDTLKELYNDHLNFSNNNYDITKLTSIFNVSQEKVEGFIDEGKVNEEFTAKSSHQQEKEEQLRISVKLLSKFLEHSGEMTVIRNNLMKTLGTLQRKYHGVKEIETLSESLTEMNKVSSILQNQISEMKKVGLESIFRPMRRVIRDASNSCKKEVSFNVTGESLRVDSSIGKVLSNVLVHLLRNAVDHGIESSEKRVSAGKDPIGKIEVLCSERDESIFIEIKDDGGGINPDVIKKIALSKSLYSKDELDQMSNQRVYQIIFESGFSTNTEVTSISGRGVGMDMVKSSIEDFGGKILTKSEVGIGSVFTIQLPIPKNILIVSSLSVNISDLNFYIPLNDISEVLLLEEGNNSLQEINHAKFIRLGESLIPIVEICDFLDLQSSNTSKDSSVYVVLKGDNFFYAIEVDQINDIEEIVVKKFGFYKELESYYLGATFCGDGELGLILNSSGVASITHTDTSYDEDEQIEENKFVTQENEFMKFSLNHEDNYCIPLHWVHRLEVISRINIEYSGERPILNYNGKALPLFFVDEQLGMNSLDKPDPLVSENLDVIVIFQNNKYYGLVVSEILDIGISSEPVNQKLSSSYGILGTTYINGKIMTVLDCLQLTSKKRLDINNNDDHNEGCLNFNNIEKIAA